MNYKQKYAIGTKYLSTQGRICNITDFVTITNIEGEIIRTYYTSESDICGQTIKNDEVCHSTIERGIFRLSQLPVVDASK